MAQGRGGVESCREREARKERGVDGMRRVWWTVLMAAIAPRISEPATAAEAGGFGHGVASFDPTQNEVRRAGEERERCLTGAGPDQVTYLEWVQYLTAVKKDRGDTTLTRALALTPNPSLTLIEVTPF